MNLHPFVVHFPVALLIIYSLLEFLSLFPFFKKKLWLKPVKAWFLFPGALGAIFGLLTGNAISGEFININDLVEKHKFFAFVTTWIFCIIVLFYLIDFLSDKLEKNARWIVKTKNFLFDRHIIVLLAIFGGVSLLITGALGGAIVRGPDVDIFVRIIYDLLF